MPADPDPAGFATDHRDKASVLALALAWITEAVDVARETEARLQQGVAPARADFPEMLAEARKAAGV